MPVVIHVLLSALKIILIILGALIGIVLLAVLLVLLVPVRYSVSAEKYDSVKAKVKVTWLLHMVSVPVVYDEGLDIRIKLFGFTLKKLPGEQGTKQAVPEKKAKKAEKTEQKKTKEAKKAEKAAAEEKTVQDGGKAEKSAENREPVKNEAYQASDKTEDKAEDKAEDAAPREEKKTSFFEKIKNIVKSVPGKISGVFDKIKGIFNKVSGIYEKVNKIKNILLEEHMKQAVKRVLGQIGYLLKKLLPRRVSGKVRFGFSDPSKTGNLLAGLGMAYPIVSEHLEVVPDFEEEVMEGEVYLEGYFRVVTVAVIAIRLIADRNVRYVFKKLTA